jgi:kynureninase
LRQRSEHLTGMLERGLTASRFYVPHSEVPSRNQPGFTIITPSEPASRGAQLSLLFLPSGTGLMEKVFDSMVQVGVVGDERRPDVIRYAPAPLYNTQDDVRRCVEGLERVFEEIIGH